MAYKRRAVREKVLQALYAYELSKESIERIIDEVVTLSQAEARTFAERLIHAVVDHQEEIDSTIKRKVTNWEFNRIAVVDRVLLRIGICEFLYFEDIPPKVSINEAIEIAKRFSTEKSGQFINGVLDSILADLKTDGRLKKTGRGLIEVTTPSKKKTSPVKED